MLLDWSVQEFEVRLILIDLFEFKADGLAIRGLRSGERQEVVMRHCFADLQRVFWRGRRRNQHAGALVVAMHVSDTYSAG
jgi:hypothetical protein